jgi:hypothetical protein
MSGLRQQILGRDGRRCVRCGGSADLAVHRLLEPRLFPAGDGGHPDNAVTCCADCRRAAELTLVSPEELRTSAGIERVLLPEGFDDEQRYDRFGNALLPDGTRVPGPLFHEPVVQEALAEAGVLDQVRPRFKYPRTLHLPESPNRGADGDHAHADHSTFEGREVVVTAKLDGEQCTMTREYIHARSVDSGYHPTRTWVRGLWGRIAHDIPAGWRVCGENMWGVHSIAYDRLPTYFLVFGMYDETNRCLSWDETEEWARLLGLRAVPVLYRGPFDRDRVLACMGADPVYADELEGFVVRWAESFSYFDHHRAAGKSVRAAHVKTTEHWLHGAVEPNRLAPDAPEA